MMNVSDVVSLGESIDGYPAGTIATVLARRGAGASYKVEIGDGTGTVIAASADSLDPVSADELSGYLHITDAETIACIQRLQSRLHLSVEEVVRLALSRDLERVRAEEAENFAAS